MMIILPFNIGDTVFYKQQQYSGKFILKPLIISQLEITKNYIKIIGYEQKQNTQVLFYDDLGKWWFLKKEDYWGEENETKNQM